MDVTSFDLNRDMVAVMSLLRSVLGTVFHFEVYAL